MNPQYEVYIVADAGTEEAVADEVGELINKKSSIVVKDFLKNNESSLKVTCCERELSKLICYIRSAKKILIQINNSKEGEIVEKLNRSYKIKSELNIEEALAKVKAVIDLERLRLDMKKPEMLILVSNEIFVEIKTTKRDYLVFPHSRSLRANIVYSIMRKSGLKKTFKGDIIDLTSISPFCLEAEEFILNKKARNSGMEEQEHTKTTENNRIKFYSLSWTSRITNLMKKNTLVLDRESKIEFEHGIIEQLLQNINSNDRENKKMIFGQFILINKKVIGRILKSADEKSNIAIVFDKKLKEEFAKNNNLREELINQGGRKLFVYTRKVF